MKATVAFENAADLAERFSERIDDVEKIPTRGKEIDLVRGNERPERQRIAFYPSDRLPVVFGRIAQRKIQSAQLAIAQVQLRRPLWKHPVD